MDEKIDWSKCTGDGLNKYSPCAFRDLLRRVEDLEEFNDALKKFMADLHRIVKEAEE